MFFAHIMLGTQVKDFLGVYSLSKVIFISKCKNQNINSNHKEVCFMEFNMTAVFHYGQNSEKHIRRFQEKRLDYVTRDLYNYTADQLRSLLNISKASDTLVSDTENNYN